MSLLANSQLETHEDGTGNLNAIVNGNWQIIDSWVNPAAGLTAAQAGVTVTASAAIFTSEHIGDKIRFASGEEATITATGGTVTVPTTTCTVSVSRTVTSAAFIIFAAVTESLRTIFARALTKKTKAANIAAGSTLVWNATRQAFEPGDPSSVAKFALMDQAINFSNTTVETSILPVTAGVSIGANSLAANDQHLIEIEGILTTASVPGQLTLRFKLAGTTRVSCSFTPPALLGLIPFKLSITLRTISIGAGGTHRAILHFNLANGATTRIEGAQSVGASVITDTTAAIALAVTAQFATANAANAIDLYSARVIKFAA